MSRLPGFLVVVLSMTLTQSSMAQDQTGDQTPESNSPKVTYALAIHGGAGSSPDKFTDEANQKRYESMEEALKIGQSILKEGGTSLDAVEAVVRYLEDNPRFNAGKGAVFNADSQHELDASIMDGSNLACGAVAGVKTIKNPISLARKVMTETDHILLAGPGAEQFGEQQQVDQVTNDYFDTPATLKRWQEYQRKLKEQGSVDRHDFELVDMDTGSYLGTVGCVALDSHGNLAAATSTGGMTNKRFGRIGDSPIVAAGTYANNKSCAVSCTGKGEEFIRRAVAYDVAARMRYAKSPLGQAVQTILKDELPEAAGGIIAVDKDGNISMEFSTKGMARAAADSNGRFDVIWHQQATAADK